jgi:hypothetical protein
MFWLGFACCALLLAPLVGQASGNVLILLMSEDWQSFQKRSKT